MTDLFSKDKNRDIEMMISAMSDNEDAVRLLRELRQRREAAEKPIEYPTPDPELYTNAGWTICPEFIGKIKDAAEGIGGEFAPDMEGVEAVLLALKGVMPLPLTSAERERLAAYDRAAKEPVGDVTYFAFSPDYGFDLFKNKQDAIDTAQEEIDSYREARDDGWDDDVRRVGWGIVIQKAEGFDAQGKHHFHSEHTYQTCEYKLCPAPSLPVVPEGLHPETAKLVINFATALAEKLHKAELKYDYDADWKRDGWSSQCQAHFHQHIAKGDPRDVAAYCAFMWYHGWKTEALPLPVVPNEVTEHDARIAVGFNRYAQSGYIDGWNACRSAMLQSGNSEQANVPTVSFYRDGIVAAAQWVEKTREAYDSEHGRHDPDTGTFEFGNDAQQEYSETLRDIEEGIRALAAPQPGKGE